MLFSPPVPKPKPGVFRITKNVHNMLQGVSAPDQRISADEKATIIEWIIDNAKRYWLSEGGPLRPPEEGGADVIVVRFNPYAARFYATGTLMIMDRSMIPRCLV